MSIVIISTCYYCNSCNFAKLQELCQYREIIDLSKTYIEIIINTDVLINAIGQPAKDVSFGFCWRECIILEHLIGFTLSRSRKRGRGTHFWCFGIDLDAIALLEISK